MKSDNDQGPAWDINDFAYPRETRTKEKKAAVYKHRTGYWVAIAHDTNEKLGRLGGLHSTELDAYKAANRAGYVVQ